jgi:hypothetical protein
MRPDSPAALAAGPAASGDSRWVGLFEERHGVGSYPRLLEALRKPCVTFAEIGVMFGVTRESVRQWHHRLLPDAPRGHKRQQLCRRYQQKRRVLADPLFGSFYRHVRSHLPAQRVTLVTSRDGFRKRFVRLDDVVVVLKRARPRAEPSAAPSAAYVLPNGVSPADFIYYELTATDYLFVPRGLVPARAATFRDSSGSEYQRFKNTFAALRSESGEQQAS